MPNGNFPSLSLGPISPDRLAAISNVSINPDASAPIIAGQPLNATQMAIYNKSKGVSSPAPTTVVTPTHTITATPHTAPLAAPTAPVVASQPLAAPVTQPIVPVAPVTGPTVAQAYKNINIGSFDSSPDSALNRVLGQQAGIATTPPDENAIFQEKLNQHQAETDALNKTYAASLYTANKSKDAIVGSATASNAARGLAGSAFGDAANSAAYAEGDRGIQTVNNDHDTKVATIIGQARADAQTELNNKRQAQRNGLTDYLTYLNTSQDRQTQNATKVAQTFLGQNIDPQQIDPAQLAHIAAQYQIPVDSISRAYNASKITLEQAAAVAKKAGLTTLDQGQSVVDQNGNLISSGGKKQFVLPYGSTLSDGTQNTNGFGGNTGASANGTKPQAGLSGDAIDQAAANYLATGQEPQTGTGPIGAAQKSAILNRAAEINNDNPGQVAQFKANYQGNKDSIVKLTVNLNQIDSKIASLTSNLPRLEELAGKVNGGILGIGNAGGSIGRSASATLQQIAGSPDAASYKELINTLRSDYGAIQSSIGGSAGNEMFQQSANVAIPDGLTVDQYKAIAQTILTNATNSRQAIQGQIDTASKASIPSFLKGTYAPYNGSDNTQAQPSTQTDQSGGEPMQVNGQTWVPGPDGLYYPE